MKNSVSLIGHVGQDPKVREVNQKKVSAFSLATSETYKKDGERVTNTTWHNLICWSPLAEVVEKYVKKGSQISIDGKIIYRSYDDKDGVTHNVTEIVCRDLILLTKKEEKPEEKKSTAMSDISELPGANESPENDPSFFPE